MRPGLITDLDRSASGTSVAGEATGFFPGLAIGQWMIVRGISVFSSGSGSLVLFSLWKPAAAGGVFRKVGPFDQGLNSDDVEPPIMVPPMCPLYWTVQTPAAELVQVRIFGDVEIR